MNTEITIRDACEKDVPQLVDLLNDLFTIEVDFKPNIERQTMGLKMLVAQPSYGVIKIASITDGPIIGMVSAQLVISTAQGNYSAWIEDMIVANAYRHRGIGKQLLQSAIDWAKDKGATRAQLLVDIENESALGYYQHLGWQSTQLNARRIFF